ncbi:MAG: hypothetical protein ACLR13_07255 [Acutalibacteraceae bacterium]
MFLKTLVGSSPKIFTFIDCAASIVNARRLFGMGAVKQRKIDFILILEVY